MIHYQSAFHSVSFLCKALNVSRSGYYDWAKRKPSQREQETRYLSHDIARVFSESRQTYGVPRIRKALAAQGKSHGKARISKLMKAQGLKAKATRRFKVTTNSQHTRAVFPNILAQSFNPSQPNQAWCADITYFPTKEGWLYLATVIDLYSRMIIGWSMGTSLQTKLIEDALQMALWKRKPSKGKGLIHHSDRGSQYCSEAYQAMLNQHGIICSMSSSGNCYDNAVMESFYHTLKVEMLYGQTYSTREQAKQSIFDYIEVFYNRQRLHSSLGYQSPMNFELAA